MDANDFKNIDNCADYSQSTIGLTQPHIDPSLVVYQIKEGVNEGDILDKLYTPCIGNKSTQMVRRDKSMTLRINKLEEVHIDLWGPHDLPS